MAAEEISLRVDLGSSVLDDDALGECAAMLAEELADLDVNDVEAAAAGDAPPGTKGLELLAVSGLVVRFFRSRKLLDKLVDTLREWLDRNDADTVRLEIDGDVIEIKGASDDERKALIDNWVQRHTPPPPEPPPSPPAPAPTPAT